jgi:hypothetical protein
MLNKISDGLDRLSTTQVMLISLGIFLLFSILVLPDQAAKAEVYSGEAGSPDTSLFYTAEDLYRFAEAYGSEGRTAYIRARFTFDLIWPFVYVAFLLTSISWLLAKADLQRGSWKYLNLVPVMGMLFDFLENISASVVLGRYPKTTVLLDHLAGFFTLIKWVLVGGSFIILLFAAGVAIWRFIQRKRR